MILLLKWKFNCDIYGDFEAMCKSLMCITQIATAVQPFFLGKCIFDPINEYLSVFRAKEKVS